MFLKKYYQEIVLSVVAILLLSVFGLIYYFHYVNPDKELEKVVAISGPVKEAVVENPEEPLEKLYVEVKGAVVSPGVYEADSSAIINDIIALAGGFNEDAYTNNINLSKLVANEMVIYVYSQSEYKTLNQPSVVYVEKECSCPTYDISSCVNTGSSVIESGEDSNAGANTSNDLVNINTAGISELTTLSGIGESKAQKIIDYRNENGNFQSIKDITLVSGISEATFEKIKDKITV